KQKSMDMLQPAEVLEYAAEDADVTLQLKHYFEPLLKKQGIENLLLEVENPLAGVLAAVEFEGVSIDTNALGEISKELTAEIIEVEQEVYKIAGQEFNIGSPKQLGEILFDKMEIGKGKIKKTKTGQYATGEEILADLADEHEIAQKILDYR